jgi:hypothetical protein
VSVAMSALLWLTLSLAPPETEPAEPPPAEPPPVEAPAAAPLDDERPEPTVMGPHYRMYRRVEQLVDRDLGSVWESYIDRIRDLEDEIEPFIVYARRRFRIRRNIGIAATCWGAGVIGLAAYLWVETTRSDIGDGQVFFGLGAAFATLGGIGASVTGAILWRRWGAAVRDLKKAGLAHRPGVAPLVLPRGGGLGLSFSF